jgi:hypothetical protein
MDKEYTPEQAKAWLAGYDEGKRIHGQPTKLINVSGVLEQAGYVKKKKWVGLTKEETTELQKWVSELVFEVEQTLKEKNT